MSEQTFHLREGDEFIELHKLLQLIGVAQTGGHAKLLIEDGVVIVDGEIESKKRRKIKSGMKVEVDEIIVEVTQ